MPQIQRDFNGFVTDANGNIIGAIGANGRVLSLANLASLSTDINGNVALLGHRGIW